MEIQFLPLKVSGQAIEPISDNYWDLGGTNYFRNIKFKTAIYGGSVSGDWYPGTDDSSLNGKPTYRWKEGWYSDLVNIGVYDATDTTMLQVRSASAGTVSPLAGTLVVLEGSGDVMLSFLAPATNHQTIVFGDVNNNQVGWIRYNHSTNALTLKINDTERLSYTAGAFAFQEATAISSTGYLALHPASHLYVFNNIGTGLSVYLSGTFASAGTTTQDSPTFSMTANYWTAGAANANWNYSILHDMITAGATPKSQAIHSINAVPAFAMENNNGTITNISYGDLQFSTSVSSGSLFLEMTPNDTAQSLVFRARKHGISQCELGRLQNSASDPYFQIGRNDTGVATNAVTDMLVLQAGAGATNVAAGFGYGISVKLSNDAHEVEERASLDWVLFNATNGSESARLDINLMNAGTMTNPIFIKGANTGGIFFNISGTTIAAPNLADGDYITGGARDSDTNALVEIWRMAGAADPYFSMGGSQQFKFYNSGYLDCGSANISGAGTIGFANLSMTGSASGAISAYNGDDAYAAVKARDNGVGLIEVARIAGAADPYFSTGGSQQFKFYNSGVADFGGAVTLLDTAINNLKAGTSAINPEVAHRGQMYFVEGSAGVADKLYIIMKNTSDTYEAVEVAIAS